MDDDDRPIRLRATREKNKMPTIRSFSNFETHLFSRAREIHQRIDIIFWNEVAEMSGTSTIA